MRKIAVAVIAILVPWLLFVAVLAMMTGCASNRVETALPARTIIRTVDLSGLCLVDAVPPPPGLAEALAPIPADSPIIAAIADWKRMRDQARTCKAAASSALQSSGQAK